MCEDPKARSSQGQEGAQNRTHWAETLAELALQDALCKKWAITWLKLHATSLSGLASTCLS